MNPYQRLLLKAADEARAFVNEKPSMPTTESDWILEFAGSLERAARLDSVGDVETWIDALAYQRVDSGPLAANFTPSFTLALDALQRSRRKASKHRK